MTFSDDDYDDDLTDDRDGYEDFSDDDNDDSSSSSSRDRAKSQVNPYTPPARSSGQGGSGSGSGSGSPFRAGSSYSSGGGSGSGSPTSSSGRSSGSPFGSSGGSGSSSSSYSSGGGSSSSSGRSSGSPYNSGGGSGSSSSYSSGGGSSSSGRSSGSSYGSGGGSGSGYGGSGSSSGSSSSSGGRSSGGFQSGPVSPSDRSGSSSSSPSSRPSSPSGPASPTGAGSKPADKDNKAAKKPEGEGSGGFGGLMSSAKGLFNRNKDDGKKDSKPAAKKDDKKADGDGGRFGGLMSSAKGMFNRNKEDDGKKDAKASASSAAPSASRFSSPFGGGNKPAGKDSGAGKAADGEKAGVAAAITGRLGGLFNRNKDKDGETPAKGAAPARSSASSASPATSARTTAAGPASATKQAAARSQTADAEPRGGIWEAFTARFRGDGKPDAQPKSATKREGNARVPELDTSGWSLDTKLDLIGIGLMFGALIMLLTSASGDQGQLMVAVNRFIGEIFGWGAVAVPLVMGGIGGFLLVTRFGDTPPEIDVVRLGGVLSGYLGLLTLFQFVAVLDSIFSQADLATLKLLVETMTWKRGIGGGFIGGQIHLLLIENLGEIGGFVLLIGWLAVSLMLITRTTATQFVVIAVSLYRSFRISYQHRQQRIAAERTLAAQAEQQRIAVSRTLVPELHSGIAGALPAGDTRQAALPLGEEPIPIRLGGQLVTAAPAQVASAAVPSPAASRAGAFGGLLKRLPGRSGNAAPKSDPETETMPTGGLNGFLSRRSAATSDAPLTAYPAASQPAAQPAPNFAPPPAPAAAVPAPAAVQSPAPAAPSMPVFNPGREADTAPAASAAPAGSRQMDSFAPPVANNTVIKPPEAPSIETNRPKRQYTMPDFRSLLAAGAKGDYDRKALVQKANTIVETLESFGAPGKVVEINTGPVITQFGVEPGYITQRDRQSRVKVSAIAQLDKDLQLALGARSIRIEAPVPGKGYVGIEVPNDSPLTVSLRDLMESNRYKRISTPLALAFGEAVDGTPVAADLTTMPHLLIAGTTGSGKSVMVNAIICSLLLRNTPDQVRFIMVDPKRVELTGYNGIPHLVAPVVVDVERIIGVLKWVTREMDDRYKKFSVAGARNIEDYNRNRPAGTDALPYIVVIIDELADLMMLAPEEAERYITRVAAMARATGIHLVIATQRPSADVVTGLIKANFPARIAFAVASNIDSRVILDQPGAEKLLGRGDMLYMSGDSPAPQRLQGVYVSDKEIHGIVNFWKAQGESEPAKGTVIFAAAKEDDAPKYSAGGSNGNTRGMANGSPVQPMRNMFDEDDDSDDDGVDGEDMPDDELYMRAVDLVRRQNGASVSLLQRKMRIGYARAARLIDAMEDRGIVGPAKEGSSKQRDVLPPK